MRGQQPLRLRFIFVFVFVFLHHHIQRRPIPLTATACINFQPPLYPSAKIPEPTYNYTVPATLLQFALVNDTAAITTKKLLKQTALADFFRTLNDEDLRLAVRYAVGRAFSSTDERTLNVGGAILSDVVLSILKLDPAEFYRLAIQTGDTAEALSRAWPATNFSADAKLLLTDLAKSFDALARTGNVEQKKSLLHFLFSQCTHPREAAYLTKIIFREPRTGVQEGVLQASIAQAFDKPLPAVQRCQLFVGDLDEVAVLAKHDQLSAATFRLFHPIQFMLATPQETSLIATETLAGRTFYAEDKLDGIRAQVHKQGSRIAIYTRTMDRTDESFPDVVQAVSHLDGDFLLDGEIVPYRDGVVLPFAHIQKRLGRKLLSARILRENPAVFIAFDILYHDGRLIMDQPLRQRRRMLQSLAQVDAQSPHTGGVDAVLSPIDSRLIISRAVDVTTADQIESAFNKSREARNEGLVLKDPGSIYSPGRRGKMWLKIKTHLPTFDCVVTAAEYGHGKRKNSLSDYTFAVWDRDPAEQGATLVNVGKAYSGVTDEEIAQLTELFLKISLTRLGRVHLVKPQVILEIACDQIQKSTRHTSGYALRFPRIKRIRWDKKPEDADPLPRVVEVYESTHNFGKSTPVLPAVPEATLFDNL